MSYSDRERIWDAGQYAEHLHGDLRLRATSPQIIAEAATYAAGGGAIGWLAKQSVWLAREFGDGRIPGDLAERLDGKDAAENSVKTYLAKLLEDTGRRVRSEAAWKQERAASYNGLIGPSQFASVLVQQPYAMVRGNNTVTCMPYESRVVVATPDTTYGLRLWKNGDGGVIFSGLPPDHTTVELSIKRGEQQLSFDAMPPLPAIDTATALASLLNNRLTDQEISRQCYDQRGIVPPAV